MGAHAHPDCPLPHPPQLLWRADAEKKQQCSFKGKDPQVS